MMFFHSYRGGGTLKPPTPTEWRVAVRLVQVLLLLGGLGSLSYSRTIGDPSYESLLWALGITGVALASLIGVGIWAHRRFLE